MINLDPIDENFLNGNHKDAVNLLMKGCKTKPYQLAGNIAQYCGYLAMNNRLDDLERLMKLLRSSQVK